MTLNLANDFLDMTPRAQEKKENNKLDYVKILNFYISKEIYQQSERTTYRLENILENRISDQALIFRIYKEFL